MGDEARDQRRELLTNQHIQELVTLSDGESQERFQGYLRASIEDLQVELQASLETSGGG